MTVKRDTEKCPTNTLFLTFNTPEMPKEIAVGYVKVKVALFVPNPMRCFNCNKFGHTSQRCKVAAKCPGCGKDKHEGRCEGPKLFCNCNGPHASSAKDCPVWQKEKEIERVRVEKRISFPEAKQLVEAKMPTVISGGKWYAAASTRPPTQDGSVLYAYFWRARISVGRHSGFLCEVDAGIGRRPGSVRVRGVFGAGGGFTGLCRSPQGCIWAFNRSLRGRP